MPKGRYGRAHQRARKQGLPSVTPQTPCSRCGHPLGHGDIDLDHNDSGVGYRGFAHHSPCPVCRQRCNQVAGGITSALRRGFRLRQRLCEVDGKPYIARDSKQRTCGSPECVNALRAANRARTTVPEPPPSNARPW
jgi:hypothetical protein